MVEITYNIEKEIKTPFKNILGEYKIKKTVGEGSYGKVKLAINVINNNNVAIKIVNREPKSKKILDSKELERKRKSLIKRILREANMTKLLNHKNISKLIDFRFDNNNFYLFFQFIDGFPLSKKINSGLNENKSIFYFKQLIEAIDYIHNNKIVHRDLKIDNIMIDKFDNLILIDFGLSNYYDLNKYLRTSCGTVPYTSPEIIRGEKYIGPEVDIWSMGVILFTMLTGYLPFGDPKTKSNYKQIINANINYPSIINEELKQIIINCLQPNISKRISIKELKIHFNLSEIDLIKTPLNLDKSIIKEIKNNLLFDLNLENNQLYENSIFTSLYNLILNYNKKSTKVNKSIYNIINKSQFTTMRNLSIKTAFNLNKQILATTKKTNLEQLVINILNDLNIEYLKTNKKDRISYIIYYSPSIKDNCTAEIELFSLKFGWLDLKQALIIVFISGNQVYFKDLKSIIKIRLNNFNK